MRRSCLFAQLRRAGPADDTQYTVMMAEFVLQVRFNWVNGNAVMKYMSRLSNLCPVEPLRLRRLVLVCGGGREWPHI